IRNVVWQSQQSENNMGAVGARSLSFYSDGRKSSRVASCHDAYPAVALHVAKILEVRSVRGFYVVALLREYPTQGDCRAAHRTRGETLDERGEGAGDDVCQDHIRLQRRQGPWLTHPQSSTQVIETSVSVRCRERLWVVVAGIGSGGAELERRERQNPGNAAQIENRQAVQAQSREPFEAERRRCVLAGAEGEAHVKLQVSRRRRWRWRVGRNHREACAELAHRDVLAPSVGPALVCQHLDLGHSFGMERLAQQRAESAEVAMLAE